jgi:beta-1,4-mannosyltransferase
VNERRERRALRVLAIPAFENRDLNPYNALLYEHLEPLGVITDEWSPAAVRSGSYDLVHIHWPDLRLQEPRWAKALANAAETLRDLRRLRGRGARIL